MKVTSWSRSIPGSEYLKVKGKKHLRKVVAGVLFALSPDVAASAYGQLFPPCSAESLFALFSNDLSAYERVPETVIFGVEAEDLSVPRYYYSGSRLMAVRTTDGSAPNVMDFEFRFESDSTYVVTARETIRVERLGILLSEPFLGRPVVAVNESNFVVCAGELLRGADDEAVLKHFERAREVLTKVLADAPR